MYLYDIIDPYWGVSAKAFAEALDTISAPRIHLRINSPGGDVFEARAMVAAIRKHRSEIVSHIDGLAASAASYVALAAKQVQMTDGAFFMIHQAWSLAWGNADELRDTAALLDKVDASIAADYEKRTGQERAQIEQWMRDETWFTATEALDAKFIDVIDEGSAPAEDSAQARAQAWNLSAYDHAPRALIEPPIRTPSIEALGAEVRACNERRLRLLELAAA